MFINFGPKCILFLTGGNVQSLTAATQSYLVCLLFSKDKQNSSPHLRKKSIFGLKKIWVEKKSSCDPAIINAHPF